jgi:hypothetical protein
MISSTLTHKQFKEEFQLTNNIIILRTFLEEHQYCNDYRIEEINYALVISRIENENMVDYYVPIYIEDSIKINPTASLDTLKMVSHFKTTTLRPDGILIDDQFFVPLKEGTDEHIKIYSGITSNNWTSAFEYLNKQVMSTIAEGYNDTSLELKTLGSFLNGPHREYQIYHNMYDKMNSLLIHFNNKITPWNDHSKILIHIQNLDEDDCDGTSEDDE